MVEFFFGMPVFLFFFRMSCGGDSASMAVEISGGGGEASCSLVRAGTTVDALRAERMRSNELLNEVLREAPSEVLSEDPMNRNQPR